MKVRSLMSNDVATCRPDDSLEAAARLMWEHDCGCVPVVDEERRVTGMITDRDACMAAYLQGRRLRDIRVSQVTRGGEAWCCHADDDASEAEALMQEKRVRRLPVVDAEGHIEGIVSLNDLARRAERMDTASARRKSDSLGLEEVAETLKAVGEPRPRALVAMH